MFNANELTLTTSVFADIGLAYAGPLTEVVIWRDSRTNKIVHAQPGEYIVKDSDGYPRRYSAEDFALLFDAVSRPSNVTSGAASSNTQTGLTLTWTDSATNKVNVYSKNPGTGLLVFLAQVDNAVQTKAITGLVANTSYTFVLKAVNAYGAEGTGVEVATGTQPASAPTSPTGSALATTAATISWTNAYPDLGIAVYRATSGAYSKVGSTLPAGTTYFNNTGLTTGTAYHYKLRHVSAAGVESADSTPIVDITTP